MLGCHPATAGRTRTIFAPREAMSTTPAAPWRSHLIESTEDMRSLLRQTRRIAVLGIKPESRADQPAYFVAAYTQEAGFEVVPVPVYYPEVTEILGQRVYRRLVDIPGEIDMVNVFRRPEHVLPHVDDIIAKRPRSVWLQLGIRNDEAAERLAQAGIDVIQDRCLKVELMRMGL
jgi:predicted CoA-binding protein